jgi:sodium transport system permease protein
MKIFEVMRTETVSNLRDRRTILSAFLLGPFLGPLVFGAVMSLTVHQISEKAEEVVRVPMLGADRAPNLVAYLAQHGIEARPAGEDREALVARVTRGDAPFALALSPQASALLRAGKPMRVELISDWSSSNHTGALRRISGALEAYGQIIAAQRLLLRGVPPEVIRPISVDETDLSTASGRAVALLGMVSYFVLFATLLGGMYLANDATAGERERGSLEPLLILPVRRADLALGKVAATALFSAVSMALSLVGFLIAVQLVPFGELGMNANFGPRVMLGAALALLPFAVLGAALLNVVAAFTKTYKEAQSYLGVALLVPTLPILFASIVGVRSSPALLAIPALSQHLIITDLLRAEPVPAAAYAICWGTTLAVAALLSLALVRRYRSEALLG